MAWYCWLGSWVAITLVFVGIERARRREPYVFQFDLQFGADVLTCMVLFPLMACLYLGEMITGLMRKITK